MNEKANDSIISSLLTWTPIMGEQLALAEELLLTEDHWLVIHYLRNFYLQFHRHPALRILIKQLAIIWPPEKAQSLYLHQLFPEGVIKQASRIGGLPIPLKCL